MCTHTDSSSGKNEQNFSFLINLEPSKLFTNNEKKNEKEEEENYYWINKNFGWKFETENRLHCLIKIKKNSGLDSSKDNQSWISFDRKKNETKNKPKQNAMNRNEKIKTLLYGLDDIPPPLPPPPLENQW